MRQYVSPQVNVRAARRQEEALLALVAAIAIAVAIYLWLWTP